MMACVFVLVQELHGDGTLNRPREVVVVLSFHCVKEERNVCVFSLLVPVCSHSDAELVAVLVSVDGRGGPPGVHLPMLCEVGNGEVARRSKPMLKVDYPRWNPKYPDLTLVL